MTSDLNMVDVKCEKCGISLPFENGAFQSCPVCGRIPDEQQIRETVYIQLAGQKNAVIKREFADLRDRPDDLVYVHPLAEHLPRYAMLEVSENQLAVYQHAGKYEHLTGPGRMILTGDDRSDADILKAYALGEGEHVLRNIGTKVTFVDLQRHNYTSALNEKYRRWKIELTAHYQMQIENQDHLLETAFDMRREPEEVAAYIRREVEKTIADELLDVLDAYPDIDWDAIGADELLERLERIFRNRDVMGDMVTNINRSLQRIGVKVFCDPRHLIDRDTLRTTKLDNTIMHRCPNTITENGISRPCTGSKRLPTGDHRRWVCPVCGATVRWCNSCNGYKHFDEADSENPNRFCRSCGKSNYN